MCKLTMAVWILVDTARYASRSLAIQSQMLELISLFDVFRTSHLYMNSSQMHTHT